MMRMALQFHYHLRVWSHKKVLDAARVADGLAVKNLNLYHTEDKTLESRRKRYTEKLSAA